MRTQFMTHMRQITIQQVLICQSMPSPSDSVFTNPWNQRIWIEHPHFASIMYGRGNGHLLFINSRSNLLGVSLNHDITGERTELLPDLGAPADTTPKWSIAGVDLNRQARVPGLS